MPGTGPEITRHLHVLPDFLGNRSPHADPHSRAIVDGLSLDESLTSLALRYYATLQGVAYGTRDIIAALNRGGYRIRKLFVTGGGVKNPLWLQEHADITGCAIVLAREADAVLLGSAILAATAAGVHPDVLSAMQAMSGAGRTIQPRRETARLSQSQIQGLSRAVSTATSPVRRWKMQAEGSRQRAVDRVGNREILSARPILNLL